MFALTMALKPKTVHEKWNYIYIYIKKKIPSSSVKTVISFKKKLNLEFFFFFFEKNHTESPISHQQREPLIKMVWVTFFSFIFKIFVFSQQWNRTEIGSFSRSRRNLERRSWAQPLHRWGRQLFFIFVGKRWSDAGLLDFLNNHHTN